MIGTLLGAKLGAALAAAAVGLGGVAAAAYTGVLPAGLQDIAHNAVGAPAANHGKSAGHKPADSTTKTAVGPDAKGNAAFGLCTAWAHVQAHGQAADKSIAFRNLATAAGANGIAKYCATVPHPGSTAPGQSSTHPTGQSSTHRTGKPTSLPFGSPSSSGASHRS